ncbi:Alkaline phosphatase synthesis transcriptional regulatory protein PhoP [Acaryochloris thomasi RCC1774]|uniref:Alkaline phosphatase synthesis transcriptional regulatory protein PhoP n=1 Tax=Acaryochloris thomasi RCC1774 TaxID=1764569 RepID=A0A2W1JJM0_9CYAN|nr:response regulator [Acaryochloris thomasi]PZD71695.1 Alkaline phosphatase synthesis transcriptional regulatory protein PhoP [Acaryochloris thomasi RCC1774]
MSTKQILVIDNECYIQEIIQIALETISGWQVFTAGSGREGLAMAEQSQPDAILLDVMMPDMDGLTTFAKLQENNKTQAIPVILLTAKVQAADQQRYRDLGVKATLSKPFDPLQLPTQISDVLGWAT